MKELTSEQINVIIKAQHQILDNPKKTAWSSESYYVGEIIKSQDKDLASLYNSWGFHPSSSKYLEIFNDPTIRKNQELLREVDKAVTMPSWGYAGT